MRRASLCLGVAATLLTSLVMGQAGAVIPPITVAGSADPTQLAQPGTVTFTYNVTITGSTATGVVLSTAQDPLLPADAASVRFDGATVPADTVTTAAPDFSLRAGTGASAGSGGTLSVGVHTLTFTAQSSSTTPGQASSTLSVTSDQGSVTSSPVLVPLNQPDLALALPADSGEDQPAPLGTGSTIDFDAELSNRGAASPATVVITLPAGLELSSDGVVLYHDETAFEEDDAQPVQCTGSLGTVTCTLDSVPPTGAAGPSILEVGLTATSAGKPGTSATFTVSVTPTTGTDVDPTDNSVHATIDFTGVADLSFAITPDKATVAIGHSTTLTLRVTNHGPQPAPMAVGLSLLDGTKTFKITSFDGATAPPGLTGLRRTAAIRSARHDLAGSSSGGGAVGVGGTGGPPPISQPQLVLWFIDTLQPGATATAHLTLRAKAVGTAHLLLFAGSAAADPDCVSDQGPCQPARATLTAVKAPPSPDDNGTAPIANTGSPSLDLSLLGGILILAGAATTTIGRRRRKHL